MIDDEGSLKWQLHQIRESIAADWNALASNSLEHSQRKFVREHLGMNIAALRELRARKSTAGRIEQIRGSQNSRHQ